MGRYVDLLSSLPPQSRDISGRKADKTPDVIATAKKFGREYFDGDRKYGYGGYYYDGRWGPVARAITEYYDLLSWSTRPKVLDVGCAKGFLIYDLLPWADAYGLDVSHYALQHCPESCVGRLHWGEADCLPFPDHSFDLVLSINTLHNLPYPRLVRALREVKRVSRGPAFVQVDAYRTPEEKARFEDWVLTAEWAGYPDEWAALFAAAGYDGDYCWTIT